MSESVSERGRRALAVLHEAEERLAGWSCPGTAECCQFSNTGLEPYLTEAEWRLVVDELARQGRRVPVPREDRVCAFLADGRCSIYPARPLGCRTYYCQRGSGPGPRLSRRDWADLVRRLEVMSSDPEARGLRLTTWLNRARRGRADAAARPG